MILRRDKQRGVRRRRPRSGRCLYRTQAGHLCKNPAARGAGRGVLCTFHEHELDKLFTELEKMLTRF